MATPSNEESSSALRRSLARELFQTEQSASTHCRREAARIPDTPPAEALLAVAEHADHVLAELPKLATHHGMPVSRGGRRVGKLFSMTRQLLGDRLLRRERSYRGTLLGMKHGLDVVRMLRQLAEQVGDEELFNWCEGWLTTRCVLVQKAEEELRWFAERPAVAMQIAVTTRRPPAPSVPKAEEMRDESETETGLPRPDEIHRDAAPPR